MHDIYVMLYIHAAVKIQDMSHNPYHSHLQCLSVFTDVCGLITHKEPKCCVSDKHFCIVLTGVQCIAVLATKKGKASHPHNRVTFSPALLWSGIQSIKHRGWEKTREWFPLFFNHPFSFRGSASSVSLWSAQVHFQSQTSLSHLPV